MKIKRILFCLPFVMLGIIQDSNANRFSVTCFYPIWGGGCPPCADALCTAEVMGCFGDQQVPDCPGYMCSCPCMCIGGIETCLSHTCPSGTTWANQSGGRQSKITDSFPGVVVPESPGSVQIGGIWCGCTSQDTVWQCQANHFGNPTATINCTACPAGHTSPAGSTNISHCVPPANCPDGQYRVGSGDCNNCPILPAPNAAIVRNSALPRQGATTNAARAHCFINTDRRMTTAGIGEWRFASNCNWVYQG